MSFTSPEKAPSRGSIPCTGNKKAATSRLRPQFQMVEVRGIARGGPRGALRRVRALRAALANAFAFTQLRALTGFDPVHG